MRISISPLQSPLRAADCASLHTPSRSAEGRRLLSSTPARFTEGCRLLNSTPAYQGGPLRATDCSTLLQPIKKVHRGLQTAQLYSSPSRRSHAEGHTE